MAEAKKRAVRSRSYQQRETGLFPAQPADCRQLRCKHRKLSFNCGNLLFVFGVTQGFLGALLGFQSFRFIEIVAPDRSVGKHGHDRWLDLEDSASHEDQVLFTATGRLDPHGTRLDARDQRRMSRIDAEFAGLARQNHEFRLAGKNLLFAADDVYMKGIGHYRLSPYCSVLAFSNASSMPPTM